MPADGFAAAMDTIMNKYGADRAVYHGGDLNGNGSRRLMGSAGNYFDELKQASLLVKEPDSVLTEDKIRTVFDKYKKMYLLPNQIYSLFRDVLPSEADLERLEKAIELCRVLWMNLGISVTPKMHLLFDGESFAQYKRLKGIGDKEEDFLEKGHQLSMRDNRCTWNMRNCEQQQLSQVRHNRRGLQTVVSNITINVHKSKRRKLSQLQFVNGEAGVSLKTEKDREKAVVKKEK